MAAPLYSQDEDKTLIVVSPLYIMTICIILCSVLLEQNLYKLRGIF